VKKSSLVLSLVAVAVIAAYGGYRTGQHGDTSNAATPNQASVAGEGKAERKVLYYRNPMGLPDTSPTPKKDSMGMDYIAVYEGDEPDGEGAVKVSPARLQTLGVKTAKAEMQVLDGGVRAVGRIEVDERQTYDIAPRFEGWIERLLVNASGDPVKRGQPLFSVYSPELVSAQKELAIAQALKLDTPGADPSAREAAQGRCGPRTTGQLAGGGQGQPGWEPDHLCFAGRRHRSGKEGGRRHALRTGDDNLPYCRSVHSLGHRRCL
jgi:Cu(I)/Ag(I) efflux system membrane fusion protein